MKRFLVILGAVAALYCTVGTWLFPEWFFGIFWGGKFWAGAWWMDGVSYWRDLHTGILALAVILAFVVAILAYAYRRFFLPFIDRFAWRLIFGFGVAILATALLDYKYARASFDSWQQIEGALANLRSAVQQVFAIGQQPVIEVPLDFQYLDRFRVEALYSQLEPELIEKQRTVSAGESLSGKGSLAVGPAGGEVGAARQKGSMSSFERASFSPERKCVEVMRVVLERKTAHYYTDGSGWFARRLVRTLQEQVNEARQDSQPREITWADLEKLRYTDQPPTKEEQEETNRRLKQYEQEFEMELKSLSGLVLIDATFAVGRTAQGNLLLVEEFSKKPRHVVFRVLVPETTELTPLLVRTKSRLRVFGTVTQPLGDDGVVEIRAIALY